MKARLRSWWQQIKHHRLAIGVGVIALVIFVALITIGYLFNWTGFKGKTLWDWLQLLAALAIPIVVGFGAAWLTAQQAKVSDRENKDNQHETALQAYIDKMSELLLVNDLRKSTEDAEVRKIARVRTLTILPRLDANRKRSVLQFLYESDLISKDTPIIVLRDADLSQADLSGANLLEANLSQANLSQANLSDAILHRADLYKANLSRADLTYADLSQANLTYANLSQAKMSPAYLYGTQLSAAKLSEADLSHAYMDGADMFGADMFGANLRLAKLSGADLSEAILSRANLYEVTITLEQLEKAKSLIGATMPDGSIHP